MLATCPLLRRGAELEIARWLALLALETCGACAATGARARWAWALRDALALRSAADLRDALDYASDVERVRCSSGGAACRCRAGLAAAAGLPALLGVTRAQLFAAAQWLVLSRLLPRLQVLDLTAALDVPQLPPALRVTGSKREHAHGAADDDGFSLLPLAELYPKAAAAATTSATGEAAGALPLAHPLALSATARK